VKEKRIALDQRKNVKNAENAVNTEYTVHYQKNT